MAVPNVLPPAFAMFRVFPRIKPNQHNNVSIPMEELFQRKDLTFSIMPSSVREFLLHFTTFSACGQQCDKSADVNAAGPLRSDVVARRTTVGQVSVAESDSDAISDCREVPFLGDCGWQRRRDAVGGKKRHEPVSVMAIQNRDRRRRDAGRGCVDLAAVNVHRCG
jgi:hypothetical protein